MAATPEDMAGDTEQISSVIISDIDLKKNSWWNIYRFELIIGNGGGGYGGFGGNFGLNSYSGYRNGGYRGGGNLGYGYFDAFENRNTQPISAVTGYRGYNWKFVIVKQWSRIWNNLRQ